MRRMAPSWPTRRGGHRQPPQAPAGAHGRQGGKRL